MALNNVTASTLENDYLPRQWANCEPARQASPEFDAAIGRLAGLPPLK